PSTVFSPVLLPLHFFFSMTRSPPTSTLFPYTTLFRSRPRARARRSFPLLPRRPVRVLRWLHQHRVERAELLGVDERADRGVEVRDRKSTRLNSSHVKISYAVFCLKKKTNMDAKLRQTW